MLFLSILKGIPSVVLCGIIQTAGPICFSHLPFLQCQSMPPVMIARTHMSLSAWFCLQLSFSWKCSLFLRKPNSSWLHPALPLAVLGQRCCHCSGTTKVLLEVTAARRAEQMGEVYEKTELRLQWIWGSGNHLGKRYRML